MVETIRIVLHRLQGGHTLPERLKELVLIRRGLFFFCGELPLFLKGISYWGFRFICLGPAAFFTDIVPVIFCASICLLNMSGWKPALDGGEAHGWGRIQEDMSVICPGCCNLVCHAGIGRRKAAQDFPDSGVQVRPPIDCWWPATTCGIVYCFPCWPPCCCYIDIFYWCTIFCISGNQQ